MKKWIAGLLCILMLTACMTGCKKDKKDNTATKIEENAYEGQTLTVYTDLTEESPEYAVYMEQVAAFETRSGATVTVNHYGENLPVVLASALEDGKTVDVFKVGTLQELSGMTKYALDLQTYAASFSSAYRVCMDKIKALSGGQALYALPVDVNLTAMWYNKAAFEAAGVSAPATVEEFEAASRKLVEAGYQPIALDSAYVLNNFAVHMERALGAQTLETLCSNGGWADNADAVAACQKLIDWVGAGYFDENAPADWPFSQLSLADRTTMIYGDMNLLTVVEEMLGQDLDWGCFAYPGNSKTVNVDCGGLCINAESLVQDLAWAYISYMTTGEADQAISAAAGSVPNDSANTSELYAEAMDILKQAEGLCDSASVLKFAAADLTEAICGIYAGDYADGAEAAAALDALY